MFLFGPIFSLKLAHLPRTLGSAGVLITPLTNTKLKGEFRTVCSVNSEKSVSMIHSRKEEFKCDLVASWTVQVGDLDQALHLWRYTGGFSSIDKCNALLAVDKVSLMTHRPLFYTLCLLGRLANQVIQINWKLIRNYSCTLGYSSSWK